MWVLFVPTLSFGEAVYESGKGGNITFTASTEKFLVFTQGDNTSQHTGITSCSISGGYVQTLAVNTGNKMSHSGVFYCECNIGDTVRVVTTGNGANGYAQTYMIPIE